MPKPFSRYSSDLCFFAVVDCGLPPLENVLPIHYDFQYSRQQVLGCMGGYNLIPETSPPPVVVCDVTGNWLPDPSYYTCKRMWLVLIVTSVVLWLTRFICSFLLCSFQLQAVAYVVLRLNPIFVQSVCFFSCNCDLHIILLRLQWRYHAPALRRDNIAHCTSHETIGAVVSVCDAAARMFTVRLMTTSQHWVRVVSGHVFNSALSSKDRVFSGFV